MPDLIDLTTRRFELLTFGDDHEVRGDFQLRTDYHGRPACFVGQHDDGTQCVVPWAGVVEARWAEEE